MKEEQGSEPSRHAAQSADAKQPVVQAGAARADEGTRQQPWASPRCRPAPTHLHSRVLDGGGAVAVLCLQRLVGPPLALHREHSQLLQRAGGKHRGWQTAGRVAGLRLGASPSQGPPALSPAFHNSTVGQQGSTNQKWVGKPQHTGCSTRNCRRATTLTGPPAREFPNTALPSSHSRQPLSNPRRPPGRCT